MIISAPTDYREAARRRLPRFVFDYIDGGSYGEHTLRSNVDDLGGITLRQRVLKSVASLSLETELLGQKWALPVALGATACVRAEAFAGHQMSTPWDPHLQRAGAYACLEDVRFTRQSAANDISAENPIVGAP
jgi:FMN-dependent dehydrogenase